MILYGFFILVCVASAVAASSWRRGIYAMVVIGLLQDPVRKLVPGAPGYFVLATIPVWTAMVIRMILSGRRRHELGKSYRRLGLTAKIFVVSLLPAAIVSASYGPGSWKLTILGAFTYLSLLVSVQVGYRFARGGEELKRFVGFYCVAVAILLTGTLLEYLDVSVPGLGTEAMGTVWVRHIWGTAVYMVAGFFRSPDIMGWHGAMLSMLSLTLAMSGDRTRRWLWMAFAIWGGTLVILCGRRKMVYMLPFFVVAATIMFIVSGKRVRVVSIVSIVLIALMGGVVIYKQAKIDSSFMTYYSHDPSDVLNQVERHGYSSLLVTLDQSGFLGEGLGTASTGAHHLDIPRPRVWQESGPSRLLVELGVPGFLCFIAMVVSTLESIWRLFRERLPRASRHLSLWVGLFAAILANAGVFLVSAQVFGDPFLTSLLAIFIGALLSSIRLETPKRLTDSVSLENVARSYTQIPLREMPAARPE